MFSTVLPLTLLKNVGGWVTLLIFVKVAPQQLAYLHQG